MYKVELSSNEWRLTRRQLEIPAGKSSSETLRRLSSTTGPAQLVLYIYQAGSDLKQSIKAESVATGKHCTVKKDVAVHSVE